MSLGITMDEVWQELGKRAGITAVTDKGFAKSLMAKLQSIEINEDEFHGID